MAPPWHIPPFGRLESIECTCELWNCFSREWFCMEPDFGSHKDLRSPSIPKHRRRKDVVKYYSYRAVRPSWIGQNYYALQLVSSTTNAEHTELKTLRYLPPSSLVTKFTEQDVSALVTSLIHNASFWSTFLNHWIAPTIPVTSILASKTDTPYSDDNPYEITKSDITDAKSIPIDLPTSFSETMPDHLHLEVCMKTWTKQDNYKVKEYFSGGPDVRHHRGKRRFREKRHQKWGEKERGRGQKQRGKALHHETWQYLGAEWDRRKLSEELPASVVPTPSIDLMDACVCWIDVATGVYIDQEREYHHGKSWVEPVGERSCRFCRAYVVDERDTLFKVLEWVDSTCDYDYYYDYEEMGECKEGDTVSTNSDVVVLEQVVDCDADVDAMSDLAEVLVQEEWDVLSEASSSNDSLGYVTIN